MRLPAPVLKAERDLESQVGPRECHRTLRLFAESRFLVSGSDDGRLDLWEFSATEDAALANLHSAVAHDDIITDVATSREAPTVASSSRDCRHRPRTPQPPPRPSNGLCAVRAHTCVLVDTRPPACLLCRVADPRSLHTQAGPPRGAGMRLPH